MTAKIIAFKPRSSPLNPDWNLTGETIPATPEIARLVGALLDHRLIGKLFGGPEAYIPAEYEAFTLAVFNAFAHRGFPPAEIAALTGVPRPIVEAFIDGLTGAGSDLGL